MKELVIFDFDGTLFTSPVPKKDRVGNKVYGRLMSKSANGSGYGWFQDLITLSPKCTTDIGLGFIGHVEEAARKALGSPDVVCVLLTGRSVDFRDRVIELCESVGLNFHGYYLKPDQKQSTGDFKLGVIDALINEHHPDHVVMWEDRDKHIAVFTNHLTNRHISHNVVKVEYAGTYLDPGLEAEVVKYLMDKTPIADTGRPNYYGVILDDNSVDLLNRKYTAPDGWVWRGHHMTIVVGNKYKARHDLVEFCDANISQDVTLTVTGLAISDRNMAIRVESTPYVPTQNDIPHITLAHSIESKPRESNELINWVDVEPFILVGKISGVY